MKNAILFLVVTLISSTTFATTITPPSSDVYKWERLGSRQVNLKSNRDIIKVGLRSRGFTKLKIQVTGGSINMQKMVVEYRNGQKETINVGHRFTQRNGSSIINLNRGERVIKDIVFYYDSVNRPRGKAIINVYGHH